VTKHSPSVLYVINLIAPATKAAAVAADAPVRPCLSLAQRGPRYHHRQVSCLTALVDVQLPCWGGLTSSYL
jgi:hypothetical protein